MVREFIFAPAVLQGLGVSVVLTAVGMSLGTVLGTVLALMRLGRFATARAVAGFASGSSAARRC